MEVRHYTEANFGIQANGGKRKNKNGKIGTRKEDINRLSLSMPQSKKNLQVNANQFSKNVDYR